MRHARPPVDHATLETAWGRGARCGVRLYHFTSFDRLALIQASGYLRVTESNVSASTPHAGPDVVWLTDEPEPTSGSLLGLGPRGVEDKIEVRIAVDLDHGEVEWWSDFADRFNVERSWRRALKRGRKWQSFWVVRRPIAVSEFLAVDAYRAAP
jgi:hypothetical protein